MRRTIGGVLVMLGLAACNSSGGGTPSAMQRCMDACARDNQLCMRSSDCGNGSCPAATVPNCATQINAAADCAAGVSDATYCANVTTTCGALFAAVEACLFPQADAGTGDQ